MRYFSEQNIGRISFAGFVVLVMLITCTLGTLHILSHYEGIEEDIRFLESNFREQHEEQLRLAVNEQITRIEARRELVVKELKRTLAARTQNILAVMENLHEQYKETKTREEIEQLIRDALRPLTFRSGRGYIFIRSLEGVSQLYPPDPSLEGHTVEFQATANRKKVIEGLTQIVREKGEGFYEYQWPKPGGSADELFDKISFISHFAPFDWYVGIGDYLEYFENKAQKGVRTVLNTSYSTSLQSYFFLYQLHNIQGGDAFATMLVNPNRLDLLGKTLSDSYTDVKGKPFRKEMLQGLRENGEAFVEYWYKKPGSEKSLRKLSYFKLYPQWNWVLGKGVYFDDLENSIARKKKLLGERMQQELMVFVLFLLSALVITLVLARVFSRGIHSIFEQYKEKQQALQRKLEQSRDELELRVKERTAELEETHAQLLHSGKLAAIGSFSASIAHEFNNPLAGVLNVLSRLQRTVTLKEKDGQLLSMALDECGRMKRLIQNLQSFNRPSSGQKSVFELRATVESILLLSKKELSLRHIRVETDFSSVPTLIYAIEDQIKQVLLNLIKNAIEAMPVAGGLIQISTGQGKQGVIVSIHDNGSGIKADHLEQIYDPFFTTKSVGKGTGLGLSVSYNIIRGHGGDLRVLSGPGRGTTFRVTLPI